MKIRPQDASTFCAAPPPNIAAILLYGADEGHIRERAQAAVKAITGDLNDPFRVAELTATALKADPARLADELGAQSLMGGRRVVWLRDGSDSHTKSVTAALDNTIGDSFLVIGANNLESRSSLRKLFESRPDCGAVACYRDEARDIQRLIAESFKSHDITISDDAKRYLLDHLGGDHAASRSEIDKLALFAGPNGTLNLDQVSTLVGDSADIAIDELIMAMASGNTAALSQHLQRAFAEGAAAVQIILASQRHFQRLHHVCCRVAAGQSADQVLKSLRPPVFYKHVGAVRQQLMIWAGGRTTTALERLTQAELECKTTGLPAETICAQTCLGLALRAKRSRG